MITLLHSLLLSTTESRQTKLQNSARIKLTFVSTVLLWLATPGTSLSQPLFVEEQRLNFGTLAVVANTSVSRLTLPLTGSNLSIEGQIVLIASGSPGRYQLSGFPAFTALSVSLNSTSLSAGGVGVESLTVDNYDFADLNTDAQGEAVLSLGARLNTTGNGGSYVDAPYSGTTVLRVDYWQPDISQYVFNSKIIDLEVEQRSTLTMAEEQGINFGTLFARSSTTGQAVITLSPTGTYTISEPDNSRLVSIARPSQGIFKVSGAASNYSLSITPQAADVLLQHTDNPNSAPHFILSDLVTTPDVMGTTDTNGELLIRIGGKLKTELTVSPVTYPSGQYEGTYQLTVSY